MCIKFFALFIYEIKYILFQLDDRILKWLNRLTVKHPFRVKLLLSLNSMFDYNPNESDLTGSLDMSKGLFEIGSIHLNYLIGHKPDCS